MPSDGFCRHSKFCFRANPLLQPRKKLAAFIEKLAAEGKLPKLQAPVILADATAQARA